MSRTRLERILLWGIVSGFVLVSILSPAVAGSSTRPTPSELQETADWPSLAFVQVADGLESPVYLTHAGDGSNRLFIVEQAGRIRILQDGSSAPTPFLDLSERVSCCGERGLLSVAFAPDYGSSGVFYADYTNQSGDTIVARFRVSSDPNVADPNSEEEILRVSQPYSNHNGGQIAFGPNDGYLYIGLGDGGSSGDPENRAQDSGQLLGKLLRIAVGSESAGYTIPPGNPLVDVAGARAEIWALGLRNPWRFSFDRETGDLFIGDVGQASYEEIDYGSASSSGGVNYGWRVMEGVHCYEATTCDTVGMILPLVEYDHTLGCSVTGGVIYRGSSYTRMQGVYLYGDYCSGRVWGLRNGASGWEQADLADTGFSISSFGEDQSGEVYVLDYASGVVYMIVDQRITVQYLPYLALMAQSEAPREWDPRLDLRGAYLVPADVESGQAYWRLVKAVWYAENEPPVAGQHHILIDTLEASGQRQAGVTVDIFAESSGETITTVTTEAKPGELYAANFPMWTVAPSYCAQPGTGVPADRVGGMGMGSIDLPNWTIHTSYGLVWQWTFAP